MAAKRKGKTAKSAAGKKSPAKKLPGKQAPSRKAPAKKTAAAQRAKPGRVSEAAAVRGPAVPPLRAMPASHVDVASAKGRPMLTWVGKRALDRVTAFPAQQVERFSLPKVVESATWADWPAAYPQGGLLFHGDNKEVLAHLLANGFRGKVKLIYIDPPFDSGADYVRKVALRGAKGTAKLDGASYSLGEQVQYTDIWANDNYLQYMYERLQLLRELLARDGSIVVHCDPKRSHQLRHLLDEVFGATQFRNEIVWWYWNKMQGNVNRFAANHDVLLVYGSEDATFHKIEEERASAVRQLKRVWNASTGSLVNAKDEAGNLIYLERTERLLDDVWRVSMLQPADDTENLRYPTQKPEALLSMVVGSMSDPGDLILDCFIGSGTTAAVAQKLGRRWIGCDINKGAIQTTSKRLQGIIREQTESAAKDRKSSAQGSLLDEPPASATEPKPAQWSFSVWRVNDYDLQIQHNEAVQLACDHLGVTRTRSDGFFDGTLGKALVKIVPFGHPLTPVDLDEIKRELASRRDEDRPVTVVSLGADAQAMRWLQDWNAARHGTGAVNRIDLIELRTDARYGRVIRHEPAKARVEIARKKASLHVAITDFVSPSILERLAAQAGVVTPDIDDWRALVDCVMIDPAWDGEVFNVALSDIPERKADLVQGAYEFPAPEHPTIVAVKIIDMLGEEVLVTRAV